MADSVPVPTPDTAAPPCFCGHAKRSHIQGQGLCLVKTHRTCRFCLIYRPNAVAAR